MPLCLCFGCCYWIFQVIFALAQMIIYNWSIWFVAGLFLACFCVLIVSDSKCLIWLVDDGFYPEKNEKHQQKVWPKRSKTQTTCVCVFQSNNETKKITTVKWILKTFTKWMVKVWKVFYFAFLAFKCFDKH